MRNSQRITKIHLAVNEQDKPVVFGIVSTDPDYKLSLNLNKKLNISLRNSIPVEFQDQKGNKLSFSKFTCAYGSCDQSFQLVSNRSEKNFLLKKLKNIDYLLLLYDPVKNLNQEQYMLKIREIDSVTGVFVVDLNTLKDSNLKYLI